MIMTSLCGQREVNKSKALADFHPSHSEVKARSFQSNYLSIMAKQSRGQVQPQAQKTVQITAPKLKTLSLKIKGTAPFVQLRFSEKAMKQMADKMEAGSTARGKKV